MWLTRGDAWSCPRSSACSCPAGPERCPRGGRGGRGGRADLRGGRATSRVWRGEDCWETSGETSGDPRGTSSLRPQCGEPGPPWSGGWLSGRGRGPRPTWNTDRATPAGICWAAAWRPGARGWGRGGLSWVACQVWWVTSIQWRLRSGINTIELRPQHQRHSIYPCVQRQNLTTPNWDPALLRDNANIQLKQSFLVILVR